MHVLSLRIHIGNLTHCINIDVEISKQSKQLMM